MGNSANLLGLYLLLGIPLAGLYAYMYDRLKRAQPDGESKDGVLSAVGVLRWIWILPCRYLQLGRKEKDGKASVVFLAYWLLLAAAVLLGCLATGNGRPPPDILHGAAP